jgi:hypothetical protein
LADVVNQQWGTSFRDDASALQGLKDNAAMRGKLGKYRPFIERLEARGGEQAALKIMEDITKDQPAPQAPAPQPAPAPDAFVSKEQYERDIFFSQNPSLQPHQELLGALRAANPGKSWAEVRELPAFRPVLEADDLRNSRTPLVSSPRVVTPPSPEQKAEGLKAAIASKDVGTYLVENGMVPIPKGIGET